MVIIKQVTSQTVHVAGVVKATSVRVSLGSVGDPRPVGLLNDCLTTATSSQVTSHARFELNTSGCAP